MPCSTSAFHAGIPTEQSLYDVGGRADGGWRTWNQHTRANVERERKSPIGRLAKQKSNEKGKRMDNLHDALIEEIERCSKAVVIFKELPDGVGNMGALFIQGDIDHAKMALSTGDVASMMVAYKDLKEVKL